MRPSDAAPCFLCFLVFSLLQSPSSAAKRSYVVNMGAHSHGIGPSTADLEKATDSHYEFLASFLGSREAAKDSIFYSCTGHSNGFAANLDEETAAEIAKHPRVVSVFENRGGKLPTTWSWEFLGLDRNHVVPSYSIWNKARYGISLPGVIMGCDKKIKVGINGFGSIGRQIAMILFLQDNNYVELVAINEPSIPIDYMADVFKSASSRLQQHDDCEVIKNNNTLLFGPKSVTFHAIRNPEEIPWADIGVDYVVESTGLFTETDKAAAHLKGGAKKVIITAVSNDAPMFVVGVNEKEYNPEYDIVSSASCITNHLVPILEVIHDRFGILEGHMKIVDSAIATQYVDELSRMDCADRRTAFFNPIPILTSGAKAFGKIVQVLNGTFGIGEGLMSTLNTFSTITDAANAVGEFLQTICDSLGIDDGPVNTLLELLSIPAAKKTTDGPCTASSTDIIPSSPPDVEAVEKVLAYLYGKLNGTVSHVPTMDGSIVDLTIRLEVEATLEDIKAAIKEESEGKFNGILGYTEGVDVVRNLPGDSRSSIFDATAGVALNENLFKFIFCFDNQWGYGCRVIDLIVHMASVQAST